MNVGYYSGGGPNHLKNFLSSLYFFRPKIIFHCHITFRSVDHNVGSNFTPTMDIGIPQILTIRSIYSLQSVCTLLLVRMAIKWVVLVSQSTVTQMESNPPWEQGNLVLKYIVTQSHFYFGISRGPSSPAGLWWCLALTIWHVWHLFTNMATSDFILDQ